MAQALASPATLETRSPTIKGLFVNSHIEAVRRSFGDEGVMELAARIGHAVDYRDLEDVPIRTEVEIIEIANDLLRGEPVPHATRSFEGGRLHFRNFKGTPLARLTFAIFPRNFRYLMMHCSTIAERVFKGVRFQSVELSKRHVVVTMDNADYPIDHFRGLFHEWMHDFGCRGEVTARVLAPRRFEYDLRWEE